MNKTDKAIQSLPWWQRIKAKILFFGIIMSIIPFLILGWFVIQSAKESLEANIKERQISVAQRAATEIESLLSSIKGRMILLADTNEQKNLDTIENEEWNQSLYSLLKQNSEIENAYVFDQDGYIKAAALRWDVKPLDYISEDLYRKVQQSKNQFFFEDVQFKEKGQPYVTIVVPFYSIDSNKTGGMAVEVNLQSTFKKVSAIHLGKSGQIFIIDKKGRLIAHTDFSQVLLNVPVITSLELADVVASKSSMVEPIKYQNYEKLEVIGAYVPININQWGVIIEQPTKEAFAPIDYLKNRLIILVFIMIVLTVIISIIFGLWFTSPIELLERAVQKVTKGNLNTKIKYNASDEFGHLAQAFNLMTEEIKIKSDHLKQEKERLDTIINGSGAGFALVYDDFRVSWMNHRLKEWLANAEEGSLCYSLLGRLNQPCQNCPMVIKSPDLCQNEIVTNIDHFGKKNIYSHRMFPLEHIQEGDPQFLIVVEDITEQRKLEEMVVQADKMSALGILASGFAHEVNNPLASISAYAEDLKERIKEESVAELSASGEIESYIDIIRNNVERTKLITSNLLNYSRKSNVESNQVNINQAIDDSITLLQHTLKRNHIMLIKKVDPELPAIDGDGLQLQQVLINLIQNAIDAIGEDGEIEILTELTNNKIVITIKDTGHGMSKEQLQKVYDPFYTTKPVGKGTGLGLYISYNIIQKMQGEIIIESQEHNGTSVSLVFPILNEKQEVV